MEQTAAWSQTQNQPSPTPLYAKLNQPQTQTLNSKPLQTLNPLELFNPHPYTQNLKPQSTKNLVVYSLEPAPPLEDTEDARPYALNPTLRNHKPSLDAIKPPDSRVPLYEFLVGILKTLGYLELRV